MLHHLAHLTTSQCLCYTLAYEAINYCASLMSVQNRNGWVPPQFLHLTRPTSRNDEYLLMPLSFGGGPYLQPRLH